MQVCYNMFFAIELANSLKIISYKCPLIGVNTKISLGFFADEREFRINHVDVI